MFLFLAAPELVFVVLPIKLGGKKKSIFIDKVYPKVIKNFKHFILLDMTTSPTIFKKINVTQTHCQMC